MEDMQESVMQYGRMRRKIEDTSQEIRRLTAIREAFDTLPCWRISWTSISGL